MIIEMGSYLFLVVRVTSEELVMLYCMTDAADAKEIVISSKLNKGFSIGRKNVADLFLDDQHMSGFHAKISFLGERFIIEDMSSTNGTWIRFSKPGEKSKPFPLEDKAVFKIGSTSTYSCRLKQPM
jgi:pSer/pThr/pTyr-binding forkhead associated (FHA) protein